MIGPFAEPPRPRGRGCVYALPISPDMNQLFPLLPLRDIVVFPGQVVSLFVGRTKSVAVYDVGVRALVVPEEDETRHECHRQRERKRESARHELNL